MSDVFEALKTADPWDASPPTALESEPAPKKGRRREEREPIDMSIVQAIEERCGAHVQVIGGGGGRQQADIADMFCRAFEDELRFMSPGAQWYFWTGKRWRRDNNGTVETLMQRHVTRVADAFSAFGTRPPICNNGFILGALRMTERHDPLKIDPSDLNSDALGLGTPTGFVDLSTGKWTPSDKGALVTMSTSVDPSEAEDCPRWKQFMGEITRGDDELARYIRLWLGYSATGLISEEQFLFVHAAGGSGKGTMLQTVQGILGDYATSISMDMLLAKPGQSGHASPIAALHGKRLVIASETEKDSFWNVSRLKEMTGGDTIRANFMHKDSFTFIPVFKLIGQGEHQPRLKAVGDGEKRRIRILPIEKGHTVADTHLKATLRAEAPGILRWLISAAVEWRKLSFRPGGGLWMPQTVKSATASYFDRQGATRLWIEQCLDLGKDYAATGNDLNQSWRAWGAVNGHGGNMPVGNLKAFHVESLFHAGKTTYRGVRVRPKA
jgi:putative DNA primase/helicase